MCGALGQVKEQGYVQEEQRGRILAEERGGGGVAISARSVDDWGQGIWAVTSTRSEVRSADPGLQPPAGEPRRGGEKNIRRLRLAAAPTVADAGGRAPL
ncbi:hypothetical protein NN561_009885 [Cricetulus griseus]